MTKVIIKPADGTGAVELFHDAAKKIETTSSGSTIKGNVLLDAASAEINLKAGVGTETGAINWTFNTADTNYASINFPYDTRATDGLVIDTGTYNLSVKHGAEYLIKGIGDGAIELYHNNLKKFETAAGGTIVTGAIQVNNTGGNGLTITSPTNESNIILTNDARSWKIVNYDYSVGNDNLGFHDGTADRMIIKNNGNVQIPDGDLEIADGHGIDFASTTQAAGMSSELFDDYEEGTFTIGLTQSLTPSSADGKYIKIGTQVFASFTCTWPSTTDTNHAIVEGLPYSSFNGRTGGSLTRYSNVTNGHLVCWHQNAGTNAAGAYDMNGGSSLTHAYFSTKRMDLVMIYNTF